MSPGAFRQFAESPCCQRILLAGCHDNGYVRMLEKYNHNPAVVAKVTLLKSFQTGLEFAALPFASTTMESVFRERPLDEVSHSMTQTHGGVAGVTPGQMMTPLVNGSGSTHEIPGRTTAVAPGQATANSPPSYAAQLARPSLGRPLPLFGDLGQGIVLVNADGLRLDCPLPHKSRIATESLNRKTGAGRRYCSMYHLNGRCGGNCGYFHGDLTDAEKLVVRHRLRGQRCHKGGYCQDPMCIYGHHCSCPGIGKCSFPANMHNVDVSTWKEVITG